METQDLRYLLPTKKLIDYDQTVLLATWEKIMKEYEKLTNKFAYTNNLKKEVGNIKKENRLNGLVACYYLIKYHQNAGLEDSKYWKLGIDDFSDTSLNKLGTSILQERTKLNIDLIRNKGEEKKDMPHFEKLFVQVENSLERNLDENMSVAKWIFILESIEEKARQLEQIHSKNGRKNNA